MSASQKTVPRQSRERGDSKKTRFLAGEKGVNEYNEEKRAYARIVGDFLRETDENETTLNSNSRHWKLRVSISEKVACKACESYLKMLGPTRPRSRRAADEPHRSKGVDGEDTFRSLIGRISGENPVKRMILVCR